VSSSGLPATLFYDASVQLVDRHLGGLSSVALESKPRLLRPQNSGLAQGESKP
jgi:hypothetical protein